MRRIWSVSAASALILAVALSWAKPWWGVDAASTPAAAEPLPKSHVETDGGQPPGAAQAPQAAERPAVSPPGPADQDLPPRVKKLCSTCHFLPPPDCEPRGLWPQRIRQMYGIMRVYKAWPDSQLPPIEEVISSYTARAFATLRLDPSAVKIPVRTLPLKPHLLSVDGLPPRPAVSFVGFVHLVEGSAWQLLVSDMRYGALILFDPVRPDEPGRILARLAHPSRAAVVDLDGDGLRDILVADLGEFWDQDTENGKVIWLRSRPSGEFDRVVLAEKLGRVNDVRAADFDGDGDLDLVAAVFGHFSTGQVMYFENYTRDWESPDFEPFVLEGRTGAINVPIADLNQDGLPDFVTVLAQQHEKVFAFLNTGRGNFRRETIYEAPHPRWGSSAIELVDVDRDGDLDILYAHGDALDQPFIARPYHGVSLLENTGGFPFRYRRLLYAPGASTAKVADLDGDGDADILSTIFLPFLPRSAAQDVPATIWLDAQPNGPPTPYCLKTGDCSHAVMDVTDYDGDGDSDVAVGNFIMPSSPTDTAAWVVLLENQLGN